MTHKRLLLALALMLPTLQLMHAQEETFDGRHLPDALHGLQPAHERADEKTYSWMRTIDSHGRQSYKRTHEKTYYIGSGLANVMDTYLSPYSYKGVGMSFTREVQYNHTLHNITLAASMTESLAGNVNEYAGNLRYSIAHQFDLFNSQTLSVKAGPMGTAQFGGIYNERNGNNPANAHASIMADLSARVDYALSLFGKTFPLQFTIAVPFVGIAYSPNFGQAYYEEFILGNSDHNIKFAYIGTTPSVRSRITAAIPVAKHFIRLGYEHNIEQSTYNNLRYHNYTHNFVIGLQM